jgi:hypothetical protein
MKSNYFLSVLLSLLVIGCAQQKASDTDVQQADAPITREDSAVKATEPTLSAIDLGDPVSLEANVELPAEYASVDPVPGECMAPVDYFNKQSVVPGPYTAGGDVIATGWNITSSKEDPVPPSIFGVFKPYDSAHKGSLLIGERTEREDVAAGNKQFVMAGFYLEGKFPATPGKYRFYVWTGNQQNMTECDSQIVIQVQ